MFQPQPTTVDPPLQLRIADEIRMRIERGDLAPGDSLPTHAAICERWGCSTNVARGAIALLRQQGLITSGRGKAPIVRTLPRRVTRSSERHQTEKDLVLQDEQARRSFGEAESTMGTALNELQFTASYDVVEADDDLAAAFGAERGTELLRRDYETTDPATGRRQSRSVSHIPLALIADNPALLDQDNEPWPGGTQHQLYTVGIELARVIDTVTAAMPTTVDAHAWGLDDGVPLLHVRRSSIDTTERVVEISDAEYPADRTELRFTTPLTRW